MTTTSTTAPDTNTLSRRFLLKAAPVGAMALAVPTAALAIDAPDRTAWDAAMRTYERAKAEDAAFQPTYDRIHEAWLAGRPSMDAIHWKEFPFADRNHTARTLDLEKTWRHFLEGEGKWWWGGSPEAVERMKSKQRAALDSVQAFRDAEAKHERESGMEAADERNDALSDAWIAAEEAVMNSPAPDLEALRWKLDNLFEPESEGSMPSWSRAYIAQTVADYQRLLGGAA